MEFQGRNRFVFSLLGLLIILGQTPAFGQEFLVHKYDDNNLPSLDVTGVSQDTTGVMWFSTRAGVVRYDGVTWKVIDPAENKENNSFRHIRIDPRGKIWALGLGRPFQLHFFDGSQWHEHSVPRAEKWGWDVVGFDLSLQDDGSVFLAATFDQTLFFYDGKSWHSFGETERLTNIRALKFMGNRLYVATGNGLFRLNPVDLKIQNISLPGIKQGPLQALGAMLNPDQGLWLVGEDWIGQFIKNEFRLLASDLSLDFSKLETGTVALAGPAGGLFFGGNEEFFHFHPKRGLRHLSKANGFVSNGIAALYLDREDNVWVTNPRGISKLISMRMESFDSRAGLADDEVTAIVQHPDGSLILGHDGSLSFLDQSVELKAETLFVHRDLPGTGRVMDLEFSPDGRLWVAFDQWGLAQLQDDRQLRWFGVEDGLPEYVYALHFDREGTLWVGGSQGLYKQTGDKFEIINLTKSDPNKLAFVRRINEALDGSLLVSTGMYGGFRYHKGNIEPWSNDDSSALDSCYQILDRGSGEYWIASSAGLCRVNEGALELTTAPSPVINRPIYSLLNDSQGKVWFGTDDGLKIWDGLEMTSLKPKDGLLGRECNRDALLQTDDGRVWVGTDRGMTVYDPLYDLPKTEKPLVSIGRSYVDGLAVDLSVSGDLSPNHYELTMSFLAISFQDESAIMFRTWLEGLEPQWLPYEYYPTNRIRYTNLPPGKYQFHLQARTISGVESEIISSAVFGVEDQLASKWWFVGLEIMGTLILLSGVIYLVMGRRYRVRLEGEFNQRTLELRATEQAVREESMRLFAILSSISDGVLAVDKNLKIVLSNPMALSILDARLDELVGAYLSETLEVVPPLVVDGRLVFEDQAYADGGAIPVYKVQNKEGEERSLEISLASLNLGENSTSGWVLAFRDITQRELMEREMTRNQQLESLGILAGGIAHDFNNLLTIMLGNLSLIEKGRQYDEEDISRLESMKMATLRARGLAEQLLTFARGGDPELRSVDFGALVKQCTDFALSGSNVSSRMDIADNLWLVQGDAGQLGQVVNNLVINAMQAMSSGGFLEVSLQNFDSFPGHTKDGPWVCLEIRDFGDGIKSEDMSMIFNPYFTTKGTGSGLGLTIVHSIVQQHDGRILAESTPGKGTHFKIFLPAVVASSHSWKPPRLPSLVAGLRVLVLDDEKEVLVLVEQMLTRLGLHCVGVSDGTAAVEVFAQAMGRNRPFSVFIADLTIPGGVGGVEAFRKIKKMDNSVRGIVISGYSNDAVMANFHDYGFGAAVRKPFGREQLAEGLAKVLNESEIRKN